MTKAQRSQAQVRIIYVLTTLFLAGLSFYVFMQIRNLINSSELVNHTNLVTLSLQKIATNITDAETNQRGYLLTGDSGLLTKRDDALINLSLELTKVDNLIQDNKDQIKNLQELHRAVNAKLDIMKQSAQNYNPLRTASHFRTNILDGVDKMNVVKLQIKKMSQTESQLLFVRTQKYQQLSFDTPIYIIVLFLGALLILLISYLKINAELYASQTLQIKFELEKNIAESIMNSSVDNIQVLNKNLDFINVNNAALQTIGKDRQHVTGKNVLHLFPQMKHGAAYRDLQKALSGQTIHNKVYHSPITDRYYENFFTPLSINNEHIGVVVVARDITEFLSTNKQLQKQNEDLQKMNQELQSFAYISSHDLQEPLRKIQIFSSRILEKEYTALSESGKEYFNKIQQSARRMQTLIEDLLAYSRTTAEEQKFEIIPLNILVEEVKQDLSEELAQKNAIVETGQMCDVQVLPFQFSQLLHNLIGNSLKFAQTSISPVIKITSETITGMQVNHENILPQKKYCHISIADNGIGFEPEYVEKIFGIFQRLHDKANYEGTGIGLAIVKKIVENHEGFITAKGEVNNGATFDIYIPAG